MPLTPSKIEWGQGFQDSFATKSEQHRNSIKRALRMMARDLYYPSLQTHKLEGHGDIRGVHATDGQVITLTVDGTVVFLRACCNHDDVYRHP